MGSSRLSETGQAPSVQAMTFPPEPASASAARRFLAQLTGFDDAEVTFRLSVLVSELVNNAVIHANTPLTVSVSPGDGAVRVSVSDGSLDPPVPQSLGPNHPSGRGLKIVDALADDWGYTVDEQGKTVWFEVVPPAI
jgi:anti-sigma regulatory factor (Ser/Thr protein kinase)